MDDACAHSASEPPRPNEFGPTKRWALGQLAMARKYLVASGKRFRQAFHQIDRSVLATRATDCHRQIVAVVARVVGKPIGEEAIDVGVHPVDLGVALQI